MKIAIDISPLSSGHKVRGVGFYLEYLKKSLLENFSDQEYLFFNDHSELKNKDIDVVHYPYFDPFFLTLPSHNKFKTVVTVHDLTPLVFPKHFPAGIKGKLRWQVQKYRLNKVDAVIADSFASKNDILKITGINKAKVNVVHLAASEVFKVLDDQYEKVTSVIEKYKLPKQFILYAGDVTWNKNVPQLIKAAIKADVTLVMVGKSLVATDYDRANPWNKDLAEVQQLSEHSRHIIKLGFVPTEDLVALYNAARVFVFPSHYEGFGLPVIEAMQSGCPVITTKGGSLYEVAGNAAMYVDANKIDDITKTIKEVFNSKKLQTELAQKGIERAREFSWKQTAKQTIEVYKKVVAQ